MAEILTFGAEGILTRVASLAEQQFSLLWGFKGELTRLRESLSMIQALLQGAEKPHPQGRNWTVKMWVKKLEDIAHDADDLLDEYEYEVLRRKVEVQNQMKKKVLNFFSLSHNPIAFRCKMAHKIKKINADLEKLKSEAGLIGLVAPTLDVTTPKTKTHSTFASEVLIIGREEVTASTVTTLINSSNNQKNSPSVMAIVGMAGLGKTALAISIWRHTEIGTHFHNKIWICVSTRFEVKTILSKILEHFRPEMNGLKGSAVIRENLQQALRGKRYLLILDDVWNDDSNKWNELSSYLSSVDGTQGSIVVVTTRSGNVASVVETLPRCNLRKLSDDQCWLILMNLAGPGPQRVFIDEDEKNIAREIAKKCEGVPLVAQVLGTIMRRDSWRSIQESPIWDLLEGEEGIFAGLKLSFDELDSPYLKQCFAYCSMFEKGFEIEKDDLIELWMAQGLLVPSHFEELEEIGCTYFGTLLENSFFEVVTEGYNGVTKFKMHNLMHDLAKYVLKSKNRDSEEIRHMVQISTSAQQSIPRRSIHKLRTVFLNGEVGNILSCPERLRVLNLYAADLEELPISIGKLKHLRYLNVSRTKIKRLPKSIGKLYNLQTLKMHDLCLEEFPKEIQNLVNLRHFYFDEGPMKFPVGIGRLTNLRSLSFFIVGKERGRRVEELGGLQNLGGKLSIYNLELVRDYEEAKKARLPEKAKIRKLRFVWEADRSSANNDEKVLDGLQPHGCLDSLEICNYLGYNFPSWMTTTANLRELFLRNCQELNFMPPDAFECFVSLESLCISMCGNLESIPSLGNLTCLKRLEIGGFSEELNSFPAFQVISQLETLSLWGWPKLKSLPETVQHLSSLTHLEIHSFGEIDAIPEWLGNLSSLEFLHVELCKNLMYLPSVEAMSCLTKLKKLDIWHCPLLSERCNKENGSEWPKISIIPNINIDGREY